MQTSGGAEARPDRKDGALNVWDHQRDSDHDVSYAPRRADEREPRERTPEQKAEGARTIADNIKVQVKLVRQYMGAMKAAATPEDWTSAKGSADAAVAELERRVEGAVAAANDATDAQVRKRLVAAPELLTAAKNLVAGGPAAPKRRAPVLSCEGALLSVLPPDHPVSPVEPTYTLAEQAIAQIFRHQIMGSDIAALRTIVRDHKEHEITRRFARFGKTRQSRLLQLLNADEVKLPARAREAAQRRVARDHTLTPSPATAANDTSALAGSEFLEPAAAEPVVPAEPVVAAEPVAVKDDPGTRGGASEPVSGESADPNGAATPTPRGLAIAALVPGVTYDGTGVFRIAVGERHEHATIQRVGTGVSRVRRKPGDTAVLEIPGGLNDAELVQTVAAQLRELCAQLGGNATNTSGDRGVPRTLTEGAIAVGPPVQREATTDARSLDAPQAANIARGGVAGASDPLPHVDAIQRSFGQHDVSSARAQVGGPSTSASREIGARAYTQGDRVGFAEAPDLRTAAHEAAHLVQQRAGHAPAGGLDTPGDALEQHADQVADAVVSGRPADQLLDQVAGTPASVVQRAAVQRDAVQQRAGVPPAVQRKTETPSGIVNARRYLELNAFRTGEVIAQHLLQQRLPQPHPRLEWRNEKRFYEKLLYGLSGILKFQSPYDVAQLLAPGDPYGTVDQLRPLTGAMEAPDSKDDMKGGPIGPWAWSAPVGLGIAQLVEQALIASMYRLGPRYLAIADTLTSGSTTVDPDAIARSHPMDRFTVGAMCQPGVFAVIAEGKSKKPAVKRDPKKPVTLTWVGRENKELWNWVRASPADATVEDVSAALFEYMTTRDHETRADYYATFLTAAPPMFGIPPQWAKTFEETKDFRPAQIASADTDPDHQIVVLGGSPQADAQALAEVGVAAPDSKAKSQPQPPNEHDNLVADATAQATALKGMLAGWKLGDAADKTLAFLARRRADVADAAKWLPVLSAQRENLTRVSTGILQLNAAVDQMKLSKTGEQAAPLREIMRFYADATACAHLDQSSNRLILRAANAQTWLTARGLGASLRDMDTSVDMMRSGVDVNDYDRTQLSATATNLREQGTAMQTKLMRGGNVPADDIEGFQIRVEETALDAKLTAVDFSLRQLESAADEAGAGLAAWFASRFSGKFRGLHDATQKIRDQISDIRFEWNKAKRYADMPDDNTEVHENANLRKAVEAAKQRFAKLAKQQDINEFLREGASTVKWQQVRTACVKLAALIGISLVGGFVGGMVARGVAGMMMGTGGAAAMESLTLGGAVVARGAGMVTETAIQSAGQSLIFDDKLGTAFLENMIMNLGSAGVLKVLGSKVEEAARLEKATQSFWQKGAAAGKVVIKETATITGHALMGAAMGYVAHKIVTGKEQPPPATLEEWLLQGAGIAVGRYVGKAMEASHARQKQLKLHGHRSSTRLAIDTEKLAALAKHVEANPQPGEAMALLAKRHEILTEELKVLENIEKSPELLGQSGMNQKQLASERAAITHQLAEVHLQGFGDVPLHLAGMKELIPGVLWSGTETQILEAIRTAHESGISVKAKEDTQGGTWHVEIEGRKLEIEVRSDGKPQAKLTPAELESRGAHAIPGARFSGLATQGDPKAKITPEQAIERAHHAVTILDGVKQEFLSIDDGGNIWVAVGPEHCLVDITVGDAMPDVAQHTYTRGKKHARIKISEHARLEDVTRAVAHELAEIRGLMADATLQVTDKPALAKGSNADKMQHHDFGRRAELDILRYELESQPSRRAEIVDEIGKLVDHLGLDKTKIATDARARKMLGDQVVKGVDLMNGKKRLQVKRSAVRGPRSKIARGNWEFNILVELPGMPDHLIVQSHVRLDGAGRPLGGPDFSIDKSRVIDGSEYRIDIEGVNSLTDFALDEAIKAFTKDFGHPPSELPGSLAADNKRIFQKEYAVQIANGATSDVAKQRAAAKTPFVVARGKKGYTNVKVDPSSATVDIVLGHPPRVHKVPATVQVIARKP